MAQIYEKNPKAGLFRLGIYDNFGNMLELIAGCQFIDI
jgi:hypothetical protein